MQLQNQCRVCILIAVMVNQIKIENTTQKVVDSSTDLNTVNGQLQNTTQRHIFQHIHSQHINSACKPKNSRSKNHLKVRNPSPSSQLPTNIHIMLP